MNIGVIGAGVAGLTAANLLSEKYNITLIEKEKRIGGHTNTINVEVSDEELEERRKGWQAPPLKVKRGVLYKYAKTVASASNGCVTDEI